MRIFGTSPHASDAMIWFCHEHAARSPSGKAKVCKTFIGGSIPPRASKPFFPSNTASLFACLFRFVLKSCHGKHSEISSASQLWNVHGRGILCYDRRASRTNVYRRRARAGGVSPQLQTRRSATGCLGDCLFSVRRVTCIAHATVALAAGWHPGRSCGAVYVGLHYAIQPIAP